MESKTSSSNSEAQTAIGGQVDELVILRKGKWNDKLLNKLIEDWKSFGWRLRLLNQDPGDENYHLANIVLNHLIQHEPEKFKDIRKKHCLTFK